MRIVLALALMLAACSKSSDVLEELPNSSLAGAAREDVPETRLESRLVRPVTIREDGPRLDACGAMGQAAGVGAGGARAPAPPVPAGRDRHGQARRRDKGGP